MSLISGVTGLLGTLRSTLADGHQMNQTTALRTNEEQDSERIARMRRESEGIDAQSGRSADTPTSLDRQRPGPTSETARPNAPLEAGQTRRGDGGPQAPERSPQSFDAPTTQPARGDGLLSRTSGAVDRLAAALPDGLSGRGDVGRASNPATLATGHDGATARASSALSGPTAFAGPGAQTGPLSSLPTGPAAPPTLVHGPEMASLNPTLLASQPQLVSQTAAPQTVALQTAQVATLATAAQQGPAIAPAVGQPVNAATTPASVAAQVTPSSAPQLAGAASAPHAPAVAQQPSGMAALAGGRPESSVALHPASPGAVAAQPPSASPVTLVGQSSIVVAAQAQGDPAFAPVAPVSSNTSRAAEAVVARHVTAIVQAERTDGTAAAARELRARTRDLPSGSAGEVLAGAQQTIARTAEGLASGNPIERIERVAGALEKDTAVAGRMAADLSSGLDSGALSPQGAHVTREIARAIANAERMPNDRLIAFGAGIAFGTGLALPLAMIDAFKERNDDRSSKLLEAALVDGIGRLMKRLSEAVHALARRSGKLAFEWAAWRSSGLDGPEIEKRLRARLSGEVGLLDEIDAALEAVETAGLDAVNALERLSRWGERSPEMAQVWRAATAAPETLFALAQSVAAQHVVAQMIIPGLKRDPAEDEDRPMDPEAARRIYADLGFEREHGAILADVLLARHTVVQMGGGWMRARRARDRGAEAAFQRLVAYLEGLGAPANRYIETITLADLDPDGERPATLAGAPLMRRLELDLVAREIGAA